jgi:N6-L-threonylcarbamoyladenine synthase
MKILSIETSCDETAVSLVEFNKKGEEIEVDVLGNSLLSQMKLHAEFGGVYPNLAKREHSKNLGPLVLQVLREANHYREAITPLKPQELIKLRETLSREPELLEDLIQVLTAVERPAIDAIAVTSGPGLEPALWVGINCAKALGDFWNIPVIPINHMEGHLFSSVLKPKGNQAYTIPQVTFPAVALLISGGHTELVKISAWGNYEVLGETRDDAVGEAFDKVARLLGYPYPGGPHIAALAVQAMELGFKLEPPFPRPMLKSNDLDFSFSGLKTAVRYYLENLTRKKGELDEFDKAKVARGFQEAVVDVLTEKTQRALQQIGAKSLIVGGGVAANIEINTYMHEMNRIHFNDTVAVYWPERELTTDNAVMIAIAGYFSTLQTKKPHAGDIVARGTLPLTSHP